MMGWFVMTNRRIAFAHMKETNMSAQGGRTGVAQKVRNTWTSAWAFFAVFSAISGCETEPEGPPATMTTVCQSDRECSPDGRVCDRSIGYCVECITGADCGAEEACRGGVCEAITPCSSSRMCPGLVCDPSRGYCVECITDVDCDGSLLCRDGDCVTPPRPCNSDRDCTSLGLVCGVSVGHCVECIGDADCATDRYCGLAFTCLPDMCTAGSTMCRSESALATCVPNGSGYGPAVACGADLSCVGSACVAMSVDAGVALDAESEPDSGISEGADASVDASRDATTPATRFALAFDGGSDGTADEVEFPLSIGNVGTRFTFEAWVRPTDVTTAYDTGGIIFIHRATCSDFELRYSSRDDGHFDWHVYPASGCDERVLIYASTPSAINVWHHVAGVFDDGTMRLYVDGALAASGVQSNPISWTTGLFGHWAGRDGADARADRGAFIGEIDEIRVSRTARYSGASFVPPAHLDPDADTVAAWLFDEGTGTTTADASPSAFDGTIRGARWVASTR